MNMMAEAIAPVELVKDETYYISGKGLFTYKGLVETVPGKALQTFPKHLRRSVNVEAHHFHPDSVYSAETDDAYVLDSQIKQGERVHLIPSLDEMKHIMRVMVAKSDDETDGSDPHKLGTTNVLGLAELLHDTKRSENLPFINNAKHALSQVLAYQLKALPGEARDYVDLAAGARVWPQGLPAMPVSREAMSKIVARRKSREAFDAEFIATVGGPAVPGAVATPVRAPVPAPAPVAVAPARAPVVAMSPAPSNINIKEVPAIIPAPVPMRVVVSEATPSPAPVAAAPAKIISSLSPALPTQEPARRARAVSGEKSRSLDSRGVNRAALFTSGSSMYAAITSDFVGTPAEKLINTALGHVSNGDMLDLSRALYAKGTLCISNVVTAKNSDKDSYTQWTLTSVRQHYHKIVDGIVERMSEDDRAAIAPFVAEIYAKIDVAERVKKSAAHKPEHAERKTSKEVGAAATDLAAAPVADKPAELPVAAVSAPVLVKAAFSTAIARAPGEQITPSAQAEAARVMNSVETNPLVLLGLQKLSSNAFKVVSMMCFRDKPLSCKEVAADLGVDEETVGDIFNRATGVLRNAVKDLFKAFPEPHDPCLRKSTLG